MGDVRLVPEPEFERFFRAEHERVLALAIAISGDRQRGRDLTQEAFLRAYRDWPHVATLDSPRAWLRRVVVNLSIDGHRRRARERTVVARYQAATPAVTFADPDITAWWDAVRRLPERQRAAVALHYLDDHSIADVAAVLGVAEGTVKSSLAQARRTLARTLRTEEVG